MKKIKEVSHISGLSKRTLQFYDEKGLLRPERTNENYRIYSEEDLKRLWEILVFKEMGFELNEIKKLLEDAERREELLNQKIKEICEKKFKLEKIERLIQDVSLNGIPQPKEDIPLAQLAAELISK